VDFLFKKKVAIRKIKVTKKKVGREKEEVAKKKKKKRSSAAATYTPAPAESDETISPRISPPNSTCQGPDSLLFII
jgi:hypothetical protein